MNYHEINHKLRAIRTTGERQGQYLKWLDDPMTQDVIAILTVLAQPSGIPASTEIGAMMHADTVGYVRCLNKMQQLNAVQQADVEATYEPQQ